MKKDTSFFIPPMKKDTSFFIPYEKRHLFFHSPPMKKGGFPFFIFLWIGELV